MAIVETERAIRRRLKELTPTLETAFEGISFKAPAGMYQRLQFVVAPPINPTFGPGYYREDMEAQIFVVDNLDVGTTAAKARAEVLRKWFYKGLTLVEDGIRIHILRTPHVSTAAVAADRIIVPVLIPLTVEVYEQ